MKAMLGDEVVQATDLKRNQRHWFERARQTGGVTIVQGRRAEDYEPMKIPRAEDL